VPLFTKDFYLYQRIFTDTEIDYSLRRYYYNLRCNPQLIKIPGEIVHVSFDSLLEPATPAKPLVSDKALVWVIVITLFVCLVVTVGVSAYGAMRAREFVHQALSNNTSSPSFTRTP
jgi:hypothetical protein